MSAVVQALTALFGCASDPCKSDRETQIPDSGSYAYTHITSFAIEDGDPAPEAQLRWRLRCPPTPYPYENSELEELPEEVVLDSMLYSALERSIEPEACLYAVSGSDPGSASASVYPTPFRSPSFLRASAPAPPNIAAPLSVTNPFVNPGEEKKFGTDLSKPTPKSCLQSSSNPLPCPSRKVTWESFSSISPFCSPSAPAALLPQTQARPNYPFFAAEEYDADSRELQVVEYEAESATEELEDEHNRSIALIDTRTRSRPSTSPEHMFASALSARSSLFVTSEDSCMAQTKARTEAEAYLTQQERPCGTGSRSSSRFKVIRAWLEDVAAYVNWDDSSDSDEFKRPQKFLRHVNSLEVFDPPSSSLESKAKVNTVPVLAAPKPNSKSNTAPAPGTPSTTTTGTRPNLTLITTPSVLLGPTKKICDSPTSYTAPLPGTNTNLRRRRYPKPVLATPNHPIPSRGGFPPTSYSRFRSAGVRGARRFSYPSSSDSSGIFGCFGGGSSGASSSADCVIC